MKILHVVESYWPSIGGMQEVVRQLSERLVRRGHDVTVVCGKHPGRDKLEHKGVKIVHFDIHGLSIRGLSGEVEAYKAWLRTHTFDVMTCFAAQNWAVDIVLELLEELPGKKVFVPTGFSMLLNPAYHDYYRNMETWMKRFDRNVFLSDDYRDINFAREHGITKNVLITNGAAADEFERTDLPGIRSLLGIPAENKLVLHVGSFTGLKGQDEALNIFAQAAIHDVTFLLAGNESEKFRAKFEGFANYFNRKKFEKQEKQVLIRSLSREETVAAYKAADLFLFPSNIECSPVVLFEAMAAETAFLVTDVGNSREIIRWSEGGKLLPTTIDAHGYSHAEIDGSARLLETLLTNDARRLQLAASGHRAWKERFTWEAISLQYENLYNELLAER